MMDVGTIIEIVIAMVLAVISIWVSVTVLRFVRRTWLAFVVSVVLSVQFWGGLALMGQIFVAHPVKIWRGFFWEITLGLPAACFLLIWALKRKFMPPEAPIDN